tara:strand:+ start:1901 stop:2419 length:519 start_codon:yes stop_codon:yes gene_type:complete
MDATKSYVKIYNISPETAEDFESDYDTSSHDLLTEMAPRIEEWDNVGWMEVDYYEYNLPDNMMHLTLSTKSASPIEWLRRSSVNVSYLDNKLIVMSTIQQDETCVTGVALMDGQILQNKPIFEMEPKEVGKYYDDDEPAYDLDELDDRIWNSISKFVNICEQFYLEGEKENG